MVSNRALVSDGWFPVIFLWLDYYIFKNGVFRLVLRFLDPHLQHFVDLSQRGGMDLHLKSFF
jgi:hypothetical protein